VPGTSKRALVYNGCMATLIKDTHKAILALQRSDFSSRQSEGIVNFLEEVDLSDLATKTDVNNLRLELKFDFYKALAAQTIIILGVVIALFQFVK